jgi:hypothetical protein
MTDHARAIEAGDRADIDALVEIGWTAIVGADIAATCTELRGRDALWRADPPMPNAATRTGGGK